MDTLARLLSAALGIWIMGAPSILGYGNLAEDHDHVVGPVITTFAVVAISQVTSGLRWINLLLGCWLLAAPWVLSYPERAALINNMVSGVLLILLSLVPGRQSDRVGGGWSALFNKSQLAPPEQ